MERKVYCDKTTCTFTAANHCAIICKTYTYVTTTNIADMMSLSFCITDIEAGKPQDSPNFQPENLY